MQAEPTPTVDSRQFYRGVESIVVDQDACSRATRSAIPAFEWNTRSKAPVKDSRIPRYWRVHADA